MHSCIAQDYPNVEILVYDDASTDSTAVAIRSEFPHAQLVSMPVNTGYIVLRNRGFREANGEYVFSLDDDAYFTSLDTIVRVVEQFEQHPQLAAIAMPYMEPGRVTQGVFVPPSDQPVCNVRTFVGCSHALRRNHVLDIDGYREFFVYGSEERDLCIRLLHARLRDSHFEHETTCAHGESDPQ